MIRNYRKKKFSIDYKLVIFSRLIGDFPLFEIFLSTYLFKVSFNEKTKAQKMN